MAEIRKFDHPKIAKEVNPLLQSRYARTGKIQDYRIHDRQMKKATQLSSSNPSSTNPHPTLKNSKSDPPTRKKPLDWKEKQCQDCRKVKESHSASKKPPFIVPGIIHHNDYFCQSVDRHLPPRFKKTKAANHPKPLQHHSSASQYPTGSVSTVPRPGTSFASKDNVFVKPIGLVHLTSTGHKLSDSASTTEDVDLSPLGIMTPLNDRETPESLHLSPALRSNPWITKQRGCPKTDDMENCSAESISPPSNWSVPKICLQDKTLNESAITEECNKTQADMETVRVAQHFREILKEEGDRLKNLCQEWDQCLQEGKVPGTEIGAVFTVVGQAELLQRERFNQFAELIGQFETKTGEKEITATDLEGFWEMIYIQVNDVDRKFTSLNDLRANDWIRKEEEELAVIPKKPAAGKKKTKTAPVRAVSARSNLRAHIAAAKKKMNASRTPLKSPSFCVRLTPPLRSPNDFRRLSNKLAEELLTNQAETSETETPSAANSSTSSTGAHMNLRFENVVDSVFKLTGRKKHNSARYFPAITPLRPARKRSSTADQVNVEQFANLNLFTEPLNKDCVQSKPTDQSDLNFSETPCEVSSVSCIEDPTSLSLSEPEILEVKPALIREGSFYQEDSTSNSLSEPEILEVKPALKREGSFYKEEINNNIEPPGSQKKKIIPAPFDSLDGSLDVDSP